jgi:hypothetical protein
MKTQGRGVAQNHDFRAIIYRITCQNAGCNSSFELVITRENIGLLGQTLACPKCTRRGGVLKRDTPLSKGSVRAKLTFPSHPGN